MISRDNVSQSDAGLPIVFIHVGGHEFLQHSVVQAHRSNPGSPIVVIGKGLCELPEYCQVVNIERYRKRHLFRLVYRHRGRNSYGYELFCFQRWIVLRDFMCDAKIRKCLYLDSDIMLYSDAAREAGRFDGFDLTYFRPIIDGSPYINASPHCCFVLSRTALTRFVRMMVSVYLRPSGRRWLDESHRILSGDTGRVGISDMTFFALAADRKVIRAANIDAFLEDGSRYDGAINLPNGLVVEDGLKKIVWQGGCPYGIHAETGREVLLHTLHFQGKNKSLMPDYLSERK